MNSPLDNCIVCHEPMGFRYFAIAVANGFPPGLPPLVGFVEINGRLLTWHNDTSCSPDARQSVLAIAGMDIEEEK